VCRALRLQVLVRREPVQKSALGLGLGWGTAPIARLTRNY
jgi:hypothetical protein